VEDSFSFWQFIDMLLKLTLAVLCGGLVGLIKDGNENSIGLSNLILASFTSALFVLLFTKMNIILNANFNSFELSIASIIIGYAIVGGAIIIGQKASLQSIFSALTLWAVAGMGAAIGAGIYIIGIVVGILMSVLLIIIQRMILTNTD
jgi:putative Mg2+ transporter-C (MgtC) family protein